MMPLPKNDRKITLRICHFNNTKEQGLYLVCPDTGGHMWIYGAIGTFDSYKDFEISSHVLSNALVHCSDFILTDTTTGESLRQLTS